MMIKRAKSGHIEEMTTATKEVTAGTERQDDIVIKDLLEVPTMPQANIDVNLDEDDGDEIAIRV